MTPARQEPSSRSALRDSAGIVGWALALEAAVSGLGALLAQHRAGSLAAQAFAAEWGAGRLAVTWSDPEEAPPTGGELGRRIRIGVQYGLGAALLALGFALLTHAATFSLAAFAPADVLMGIVTAGLIAMRDELLLRGVVLRAFRHTLGPFGQLGLCAAVAAAARFGEVHDSMPPSLVGFAPLAIAALTGLSFATLWLRERGAWMACGAHLAWATVTALDGAGFELRWSSSAWGGGGGGFGASVAVACALTLVSTAAGFTWYRARKG
jgi:hypothetical protein